jgi:RimJ/RimL family protein N-acetyltransferase
MPQPILRTARLLLVPLADRHLELEVGLDADPEVLRHLFGRSRTRDEVIAAHATRMAAAGRVDGLGHWVAFGSAGDGRDTAPPEHPDEGEFVGLMMLPPAFGPDRPDDPSVAELGYRLARRHWRRGLAREASRALLRHAFDTVGLSRVIAQTMAVNAASRAVMAAVGMRYVRTFFPSWDDPLPGADAGEVEYEITREMWTAGSGAGAVGHRPAGVQDRRER